MAGLLDGFLGDGWEDPRSQALMALSAGLMNRNFGGGLLAANNAFAEAKQAKAKQGLLDMQMANYQSEIDARKAATEKQGRIADFTQRLLNGGGGPVEAAPGQLGSGSFGIVAPAQGQSDMPAPAPRGLAGARLEDIAGLHALGGPNLLDAYKLAKEGIERKPGSFYEDMQGRRSYVGDPTKGLDYQNGRVSVMPGFADAQSQLTLATEGPKALLAAAGKVNLRPQADGTQRPVSELDENQTLQRLLGNYFGGGTMGGPTPVNPVGQGSPTPANRATTPSDPSQVDPSLQRGRDAEAIRVMQSELQNPRLSPADRAGIQREIARMTQAQSQPGFPTPSASGPVTYGKTTAQETQDKANATYQDQSAKDTAEIKKQIVNTGFNAAGNIAKYQQIGKLLEQVDGGTLTATGTHLASTMNSLGFKVDKNLPNKEAAAALANQVALDLRNPANGGGMPGAMSDSDRNFLTSMVPNASQSAQGRKQLIDAYVAIQQRNRDVAKFAYNYEKKYGRLDNGFFEQMQAWSAANPLFGGN